MCGGSVEVVVVCLLEVVDTHGPGLSHIRTEVPPLDSAGYHH